MMEARVKQDHRFDIVQAHTGRTYVRYEWRPVPAGDDEIDALEYRESVAVVETAVTLSGKTVAELKGMARDAGVEGFSTMKKAELISALRDD